MKRILLASLLLAAAAALVWGVLRLVVGTGPQGPAGEILTERIEKTADVLEVEFTARVDAPAERVFRAFREPERAQEFSDGVRRSRLVREGDNVKVVEFRLDVLGWPQEFVMEFAFEPHRRRVAFKTLRSSASEVEGAYLLTPHDGSTLVTYRATARDKVQAPPLALQKRAARQAFTAVVRGLMNRIEQEGRSERTPRARRQ